MRARRPRSSCAGSWPQGSRRRGKVAARGWRRLLEWRNEISRGFGSQEAQLEYRDFTREIDAIPANERVKRVLDEQLWDRRRKPR
jgi:hypothetical protein